MQKLSLAAFNKATLWVSGVAILVMTVLGGLDVIGAAFFDHPIAGAYEATETLLVVSVFLALGYLHSDRAHVAVDILYGRFGPRMRWFVDVLTLSTMAIYFGAIGWQGWIKAVESWRIGEYSVGLVQFPIYPARFALAIGAGLVVLNCILDLLAGGHYRRRSDESISLPIE